MCPGAGKHGAMDTEAIRAAAQAALPPLEGTLHVPGLTAPVTVHRDPEGVPHIRAATVEDAWFAQGFVHAQDRLFQMELNRRRALGRAAEWLGEAAYPADRLARQLDVAGASRRDFAALGADARIMCEHYAAGINAFIASGAPPALEYQLLAATPEPWEGWHSIAVMRRLGLLMGSVWFKLWRAAALSVAGEATTSLRYDDGGMDTLILPQGKESLRWRAGLEFLAPAVEALLATAEADATGGGSNNWAVSAQKSATGRPFLAGDPHRVFELPNMYAQGHLACDAFDVIGLTVPGVPGFPHFAHNGHVAWCVTHTFADIHDLYLEQFDQGRVLFQGDWEIPARHRETIVIRGAEPRDIEVTVTRHGPIIAGDPASGHALALKSVQFFETDLSFDCLPKLPRARTVPELFEATRGWGLIDHNLVAADTENNTGFLLRARIPRRGRENGWLPMPGWTGEHEWDGWIAHEDMPQTINPEAGIIVTANNRVVADDHPDYICTDCHPPYRAARIAALLADGAFRTPEAAAAIHGDTLSAPATAFQAALREVEFSAGPGADLRDAIIAWDGRMDPQATTPTRYIAFRLALTRRFAAVSGLGGLAGHEWLSPAPGVAPLTQLWWALPALLRAQDVSLLNGGDWATLMAAALDEAAATPATPWGEAHKPAFAHPLSALFPDAAPVLNPPSLPIGGDGDTVWANGIIAPVGPRAQYGALARYMFDVGDWENSRWGVFLGTSGHPGSPHYASQHAAWARCAMVPMRHGWAGLAAAAVTSQTLRPA